MKHATKLTAVVSALLASTIVQAQTQIVKPPVAQVWMDLATYSMMGMDEMPEMPPGMGMLGNMMGTSAHAGRDGKRARGVGNFGQTKSAGMGRQLDVALVTQLKPAGTTATHQTPPNANVGAMPLRLVTPPREGFVGVNEENNFPERPTGRILFYWGCSAQVKAGQPRILDIAKLSERDYANFMQGRSVRDRGARAEPGTAIWPNDAQNSRVARGASLAGEHTITGDGVPANLRFSLGAQHDFMPSMQVQAEGKRTETIRLSWQALPTARATMHMAISGEEGKQSGPEMIIWSSSEPPESGGGLMDYISNDNISKWLSERVLLPATQTQCEIPAGIFASTSAAMLQSIAYGNELNLVHPPRPADARTPWVQEWAVRVRNKSLAMNVLGEESNPMQNARNPRNQQSQPNTQRAEKAKENEEKLPAIIPEVTNILKGLFGR